MTGGRGRGGSGELTDWSRAGWGRGCAFGADAADGRTELAGPAPTASRSAVSCNGRGKITKWPALALARVSRHGQAAMRWRTVDAAGRAHWMPGWWWRVRPAGSVRRIAGSTGLW